RETSKAPRDKGISRTRTRRAPADLEEDASRFAFILLLGYYFISQDPSRGPRNAHAGIAPAISRSAVLPDGHGELVEEAIRARAERAGPPGPLARRDPVSAALQVNPGGADEESLYARRDHASSALGLQFLRSRRDRTAGRDHIVDDSDGFTSDVERLRLDLHRVRIDAFLHEKV